MTQNSVSPISSSPFTGLGTQTYNVLTTGTYTCQVFCAIPWDVNNAAWASALQIVINNNGTPVQTVNSPAPSQASMYCTQTFAATAGTTITVVLTSSAAADNMPNTIHGIMNVFAGPL